MQMKCVTQKWSETPGQIFTWKKIRLHRSEKKLTEDDPYEIPWLFFQPRYIGSQRRFPKNADARGAQVKGKEKKELFLGSFGKRCFDFFSFLFS